EPRTLPAGPQMRPRRRIRRPREGSGRLLAAEPTLHLLPQGSPRAEEQRLDGADAQLENVRDLRVPAPLQLAQHERRALVERELAERAPDLVRRHDVLELRRRHLAQKRHLLRLASLATEALAADVV